MFKNDLYSIKIKMTKEEIGKYFKSGIGISFEHYKNNGNLADPNYAKKCLKDFKERATKNVNSLRDKFVEFVEEGARNYRSSLDDFVEDTVQGEKVKEEKFVSGSKKEIDLKSYYTKEQIKEKGKYNNDVAFYYHINKLKEQGKLKKRDIKKDGRTVHYRKEPIDEYIKLKKKH